MHRIRTTWFLAIIIVSTIFVVLHLRTVIKQASSSYCFLGQDEGVVIHHVVRVLDGGYRNYRARDILVTSGYGGTQTFLDTLVLKLFPQAWLKSQEIRNDGQHVFPWVGKYPRVVKILRETRIFYAISILLALLWLSWPLGYPLCFLIPAAIATTSGFVTAWQGAKNDYPSVLFAIAAMFLFYRGRNKLAFLVMFLGSFVRISLLPFSAILLCTRRPFSLIPVPLNSRPILLDLFRFSFVTPPRSSSKATTSSSCLAKSKKSLRNISLELSGTGIIILGAFTYILVQPNVLVSSLEATWYRGFTDMAKVPFSIIRFRQELLLGCTLLWPLPIFCVALWRFILKEGLANALHRWGPFLACILVGWALVFKGLCVRPYYYLPIQAILLTGLALLLRDVKMSLRKVSILFTLGILGSFFVWKSATPVTQGSPHPLQDLLDRHVRAGLELENWIFDLSLHAPIRKEDKNVQTFDSLSETPTQLVSRITNTQTRFVIACWKDAQSSPIASLWKSLTRIKCTGTRMPLEQGYKAFSNAASSGFGRTPDQPSFVVMSYNELREKIKNISSVGIITKSNQTLHPRILQGSKIGQDHFQFPLYITETVQLKNKFKFQDGLAGFEVTVGSSCKKGASMALSISQIGLISQSVQTNLDTTTQWCGNYPRLCRYFPGLAMWSARRYPIRSHLLLKKHIQPNQTAEIRLDFHKAESNDCGFEIGEIRLIQ